MASRDSGEYATETEAETETEVGTDYSERDTSLRASATEPEKGEETEEEERAEASLARKGSELLREVERSEEAAVLEQEGEMEGQDEEEEKEAGYRDTVRVLSAEVVAQKELLSAHYLEYYNFKEGNLLSCTCTCMLFILLLSLFSHIRVILLALKCLYIILQCSRVNMITNVN